jgi:hypothetical protein
MSSRNRPDQQFDPTIVAVHVSDGSVSYDAAPYATVATPPRKAARGRQGERLVALVHLTESTSPHLYRELREATCQAYWSAEGSTTAALRKAASAANNHLYQFNLRTSPPNRCYGGLACVALRSDEFFVLQAGPAYASLLSQDCVKHFPSKDVRLSPLGVGPLSEYLLDHAFVSGGDTLCISSLSLGGSVRGTISQVLKRRRVQEVLDGLYQIGSEVGFTAVVARWTAEEKAAPSLRIGARPRMVAARRVTAAARGRVASESWDRAVRWLRSSLSGNRLSGARLKVIVGAVADGFIRGFRRSQDLSVSLGRAFGVLLRRTLPGQEKGKSPRERKVLQAPDENPAVLTAVAVAIPVLVAVLVLVAYTQRGATARADSLMKQAEAQVHLAHEVGWQTDEALQYWDGALALAEAASQIRPDEPDVLARIAEARAAIDAIEGIVRLQTQGLWDVGSGSLPRRLASYEQMLFVLDPGSGWAALLNTNDTGELVDGETPQVLVRTEQEIQGQEVGRLIDLVWVEAGGARLSSGLVILAQDGALLTYDPAWESEAGVPQVTYSLLGSPPSGEPKAVGTYEGRFYILDGEQITRHEPRGDVYPDPPNRYFVVPPPRPLSEAVDMAIDGYIYILFEGGEILKFLSGERQDFQVRGVPVDIGMACAIAVDPRGQSGAVYVADCGNDRIVVLSADGLYKAQYYAESGLDGLEDLAVDESSGHVYVIGGGKVLLAGIP